MEVKNIQNQKTQKPSSKTPWIICGCGVGGLAILGIIIAIFRGKKNKKNKS